ncbi:MAG: hypothetical protein V1872_01225 [bacterium]
MRRFIPSISVIFICITLISSFVVTPTQTEASIVLRAIILNPSKTKKKTIPFTYYLPKEILPEHVLDKGDLNLNYDTKQSLHFVYKDIELEPGESRQVKIEMEDIFIITPQELETIKKELGVLVEKFKGGPFYERAQLVKDNIERKLEQILKYQQENDVVQVGPDMHISAFRHNKQVVEQCKGDLQDLDRLAAESKKGGGLSPNMSWKIIVFIVIFIAIISTVMFIIWHLQIKKQQKEAKIISRMSRVEERVDLEVKEENDQV